MIAPAPSAIINVERGASAWLMQNLIKHLHSPLDTTPSVLSTTMLVPQRPRSTSAAVENPTKSAEAAVDDYDLRDYVYDDVNDKLLDVTSKASDNQKRPSSIVSKSSAATYAAKGTPTSIPIVDRDVPLKHHNSPQIQITSLAKNIRPSRAGGEGLLSSPPVSFPLHGRTTTTTTKPLSLSGRIGSLSDSDNRNDVDIKKGTVIPRLVTPAIHITKKTAAKTGKVIPTGEIRRHQASASAQSNFTKDR
jgi:hypothetical protein